jgi:hypothetical protein
MLTINFHSSMKLSLILICIGLLICLNNGYTQLTSSPYSLFAIGQLTVAGTATNGAMGGCGIAFESKFTLNAINPASYSGIDSLSFLFDVGMFGKVTRYESTSDIQKRHDANLLNMAMACRILPWWSSSIGFKPYSSVGYKINTTDYVEGELTSYKKIYEGSGGINRFYWGNTIKVFKNLSLGADISYYLGSIRHTETGKTLDESITYVVTQLTQFHTAQLDYGIQYTIYRRNMRFTLGAIAGNHKKFSGTNEYNISCEGDTFDLKSPKESFALPQKYGLGIAFEKSYNFRAGFDYERQLWNSSTHFNNPLLATRDAERFALGMEYSPYKSYSNVLWRRIFCRFGANYTKTYMIIDKVPINSFAVVMGAGIPLRRELSLINVSVEAGRTGTTRNGLIKEQYLMVHLNFTLHDKWFIRRPIE